MRSQKALFLRRLLTIVLLVASRSVQAAEAPADPLVTPLRSEAMDLAAFTAWVADKAVPLPASAQPQDAVWTQSSQPTHRGIWFGEGKTPGARHLRIAWQERLPVGAVLVRGNVRVSVLKAQASYPGRLGAEEDWTAAEQLHARDVTQEEQSREHYTLWTLPPGTTTRAVRFTHTAELSDKRYAGWLGGAYLLAPRVVNLAPQAVIAVDSRPEEAQRIINGAADYLKSWTNDAKDARALVSPEHPETITLIWPQQVTLAGLGMLWTGFSAGEVQIYTGPHDRHPRAAEDADWTSVQAFQDLPNGHPLKLWPNWIAFDRPITTRAMRLRITAPTEEQHHHLRGRTRAGRQVWLGELLALQPLEDAPLEAALLPPTEPREHPPIPIRFTLSEPGFVTLVLDDENGVRVRNLVSETYFPAGENVVWWDGLDDRQRDVEAAKHGLYHVPGKLVLPGNYRVRGLVHPGLELRFEFSVYNAGQPAWLTADGTGGWLTNHSPPSAALFVPADRSPTGQPLVYLGSYVSEGGHGLAWVDLDGRKQGGVGRIGGAWTAAPYLARDRGSSAVPEHIAYVAAPWSVSKQNRLQGEIRLTALTPRGDQPLLKYPLQPRADATGKVAWGDYVGGLAVHNGVLVVSVPPHHQLVFVDVRTAQPLGVAKLHAPGGLAFDREGRLYAFSGSKLHRYRLPAISETTVLPNPEVLIATGLEDPQQLTFDAQGNFYISDQGTSHQVKVFDPTGKPLRTIGVAGRPQAGPYNPRRMNHPQGLAIDSRNQLWVAEHDFQPKRVSVWTLEGQLIRAFYGPSEYGGGGKLDPRDKRRFYYHGMEFQLDWEHGTDRLVRVFHRPDADAMPLPKRFSNHSQPQTPLYVPTASGEVRRYFTDCYSVRPTNGAPAAMIWIDRDGVAVPVAAMGRADSWSILSSEAFLPLWPAEVDPRDKPWRNPALFVWSDLNEDASAQVDEVTILAAEAGGTTVMEDLAFVVSRVDDRLMRFAPVRFTEKGVPVYDLAAGETLGTGAQKPKSSGGDQALVHSSGWTVTTVAPQPFAPQSVGGLFRGQPRWSYPSLWPGLHASHESPPPDRPGQLIGTTRLLGGFVTPERSDAGPIFAINGNQGNIYLFTADGLFVAQLFQDSRQGKSWSMPLAPRGMLLNELSLHDENFWPTITQTAEQIYLVDGRRTSLVRVDQLDKIRRLPDQTLQVTSDDLRAAQAYFEQTEARRQALHGTPRLEVVLRSENLLVDGQLKDWRDADWAIIDRRGVRAYFNSDSKPFDMTAAVTIAGGRLYVAYRTGDQRLLRNSGEVPQALFTTGGGLDLMLAADPQADPQRKQPVEGDLRLFVTQVAGKTRAVLYRAVVPGSTDPIPFSSPARTITFDRVEDVSDQVELAGAGGNYEISVPLELLGVQPQPGQQLQADLGVLRGDGFQTTHRVYWSNKATGLTSDVPSEAMLTPALWGRWELVEP